MKGCKNRTDLLPCASCPFRKDRDASGIPGYDHAKAIALLSTVGDGDGFRSIMACHGSSDAEPRSCKGYLARHGWSNINVRLRVARRQIENPSEVEAACRIAGIDLEPDYPTVLKKLRRTRNQRRMEE